MKIQRFKESLAIGGIILFALMVFGLAIAKEFLMFMAFWKWVME